MTTPTRVYDSPPYPNAGTLKLNSVSFPGEAIGPMPSAASGR